MLIHGFSKSCEHEIVFVLIYRTNRSMSSSQLLQKVWIIKQTVVFLWENWQKYGSVSYSFSCTLFFDMRNSSRLLLSKVIKGQAISTEDIKLVWTKNVFSRNGLWFGYSERDTNSVRGETWKHLTHLWKTFFPVSSREPDRRKDGGEPGGVTCSSFNLTAELNLRKVDLGEVDLCFSRLRRLATGEGW